MACSSCSCSGSGDLTPSILIKKFSFGGTGMYDRLYCYATNEKIDQKWERGKPIAPNVYNGAGLFKIKSKPVFVSPELTISPPIASGCDCTAKIRIKKGSTVIAEVSGVTLSGGTVTLSNITTTVELSDVVKKEMYIFKWEISFNDGSTWCSIGDTDQIPFYWVANDPSIPAGKNIFDLALDKACGYVAGDSTYASKINTGISSDLTYNPGTGAPAGFDDDSGGILAVYGAGQAVCLSNAYLLQYLLKSIGATAGSVICYWGGTSTSQVTFCKLPTPSSACGTVNAYRSANPPLVAADPRFSYHAMTAVSGTTYDPSYGSATSTPSSDFFNLCSGCALRSGGWGSYTTAYSTNRVNNC